MVGEIGADAAQNGSLDGTATTVANDNRVGIVLIGNTNQLVARVTGHQMQLVVEVWVDCLGPFAHFLEANSFVLANTLLLGLAGHILEGSIAEVSRSTGAKNAP